MTDEGSLQARGAPSRERSSALRTATSRSEIRRAWAVIGIIVVVVVMVLLRDPGGEIDLAIQLTGLLGIALLLAVQFGVLLFVRWLGRFDRDIPIWFSAGTVVIECLVPTAIVHSHIWSGTLEPYAALSSPPVLVYGLLVTMTTLRLKPWLCVLGGIVSAAGYGALYAWVHFGIGLVEPTTGLPKAGYGMMLLLLMMSGVAAAWVCREIRGHLETALTEAENRRRIDRLESDLAVAQSIQRALLPHSAPSIPGFDIAGWNRPADQTGGDYYDWQQDDAGGWIITLADVSGHGVGPAMVTAACRAYVRASGAQFEDLAALTTRINRLLSEDLADGRFITMVSVRINPPLERSDGHDVTLLSAGHGPIILYVGSSRNVEEIEAQGLPLAVDPESLFGPVHTLRLEPGDVLALVTDGYHEWSRDDARGVREQFGMHRLREALERHSQLSAAAMIEAITAEVEEFAGGGSQQDDLTMVILKRL